MQTHFLIKTVKCYLGLYSESYSYLSFFSIVIYCIKGFYTLFFFVGGVGSDFWAKAMKSWPYLNKDLVAFYLTNFINFVLFHSLPGYAMLFFTSPGFCMCHFPHLEHMPDSFPTKECHHFANYDNQHCPGYYTDMIPFVFTTLWFRLREVRVTRRWHWNLSLSDHRINVPVS